MTRDRPATKFNTCFALRAHPAAAARRPGPSLRLHAEVAGGSAGWHVRYVLAGAVESVRLPPSAARPARADDLWRHTCFEAFVARGERGYREFNFAPSGDWAAYDFAAERLRAAAAPAIDPAPRIACTRSGDGAITLDVRLAPAALGAAPGAALGLAAVIESTDGALTYWALAHPRAVPDFHHARGWTGHLPAACG